MKVATLARPLMLLAAGLVAMLAPCSEAAAQGSGIQLTPDSRRYLVSKDVGSERWAISFNLADRTVTGNVFRTDGSAPAFIWCRITSETPAPNPVDTRYVLDCFGAPSCEAAPCSSDAWTPIASGLEIGGDSLLPEETRATFRGRVQPIFTARCALPACHAGDAPQEGLNLEAGQAYDNVFLRLPANEDEHFLIEPFDPNSSHLFLKILGLEEGEQMPLGGPPLSEEDTQAMRDWITEGAADN
jgi:hypothetical protein